MNPETIPAKTIVTKTKNRDWFGCDYNMNIYRGCNHGCIYCDSRSECYRVEDFDTVKPKRDAIEIIARELRGKSGVVATGAMSDPYNPLEKDLLLTARSLKLLAERGLGVALCTKSPLVARDCALFLKIAHQAPALVKMTVTTADDKLCRQLEPNVAPSGERFAAIKELSAAGVYCGVLLMPVLPFINDTEENVLSIAHAAANAGARFVYAAFGVTLRQNQRDYFLERLTERFPGKASMYMRRYGSAYACVCPDAKRLYLAFERECRALGLLYRMKDIVQDYQRGYFSGQMSLF